MQNIKEKKNYGVEWISEIPKEWTYLRNKYCFDLKKNIVGNESDLYQLLSLTKNGIKEIGRDEQNGKVPESFDTYQIVDSGDIVMCLFDLDVSAVFSGICNKKGIISSAYKCLQCKEVLNNRYVDYFFRTVFVDRKYKRYSKNVRYSISVDEFMDLSIAVPPIDEQQKIADFLDFKCKKIDDTIEKINEQIDVLKKNKQSLITEVVTKGLDRNVEMKNTELVYAKKIPKHWKVIKFKYLGEYRNGLTYSPQDICDENEGTLVLRSSNIQNGRLVLDDNVYVTTEVPDELRVKKGDILICSRNGSRELIGKNALISDIYATFGAFMMIYRTKEYKYLYYILNSDIFRSYLGVFFTSTINQLTGQTFGNMKIPYCDDEIEVDKMIKYLNSKCEKIDNILDKKIKQIETLEQYKKSLIYEYVTGKKSV